MKSGERNEDKKLGTNWNKQTERKEIDSREEGKKDVVNRQVEEKNINVVEEWRRTKRKIERQKRRGYSEIEMRRRTR